MHLNISEKLKNWDAHSTTQEQSTRNTQIEGTHNILLMYDKALLKLVHCCPKAVKCQRQHPHPANRPLPTNHYNNNNPQPFSSHSNTNLFSC